MDSSNDKNNISMSRLKKSNTPNSKKSEEEKENAMEWTLNILDIVAIVIATIALIFSIIFTIHAWGNKQATEKVLNEIKTINDNIGFITDDLKEVKENTKEINYGIQQLNKTMEIYLSRIK